MGSVLSSHETAPSHPIPAGPDLRIVLIGKTGVGKSAVGNTILGVKDAFPSVLSASSVTENCEKRAIDWCGRNISVVDTPGILDTNKSEKVIQKEILRCIQYSSPGPHAIVLVMQAGRFTKEERNSVEALQKLFGPMADKYMIVLFTHGDNFTGQKTIQDFVRDSPTGLQTVIQRCGTRFHLFDNMSTNRGQVVELIKKIDDMVAGNGNACYTNEMYREAERVISQQPEPREVAEKKTYDFTFLRQLVISVAKFMMELKKD